MKPRSRRVRALLAAVVALTACTTTDQGAGSTSSTAAAGTTTVTAAPPADDLYAPDPAPPRGLPPSFNESGGCGVAQGVRGPYATIAGDLADTEEIRGPWGDFYGRDFAEVRTRLVEVALPMTGDRRVTVWVHRAVQPALEAVIANLEREEAGGNYYEIRAGEVSSFRPATVPPKRYLSFHAVGAAIDINTTTNPYRGDNVLVTDMPHWFVAAWTDAGWCWGGDWETIKDPMHFSWQGPLHTADYQVTDPVAVRTEPAPFNRSLTFATVLGPAPDGSRLMVADADRDGAPDALRLHPWTAAGSLGVGIAQAMYGFRTGCTPLVTSPVAPGAAFLMGDGNADGRPDLWEIKSRDGVVLVTIHTLISGYSQRLRPRETGIRADPDAVFLAGDHDRDGHADLYVVLSGTVEIWAGPTFTNRLLRTRLPNEVGPGWRFALGDHHLDGVPDLFALSPDDPARLLVVAGAGDMTGEPETMATGVSGHDGAFAVGDLDGDGRPDLYLLDLDGTLTVYLGGDRGDIPNAGLTYWFAEGNDQPPTRQEACPVVPPGR